MTPEQFQNLGAAGILGFMVLYGGKAGLSLLNRIADRMISAFDKLEGILTALTLVLKDREVESERRHALSLAAIKDLATLEETRAAAASAAFVEALKQTRHDLRDVISNSNAGVQVEILKLRDDIVGLREEIRLFRAANK